MPKGTQGWMVINMETGYSVQMKFKDETGVMLGRDGEDCTVQLATPDFKLKTQMLVITKCADLKLAEE